MLSGLSLMDFYARKRFLNKLTIVKDFSDLSHLLMQYIIMDKHIVIVKLRSFIVIFHVI